jgi:hypothetical protein
VDQHREEHGLNRCLKAIGLPKSTYYYRKDRPEKPSEEEQKLMDHVCEIIQEHPGYGYCRILPELEERMGQAVNHKRLRRLPGEHELGLPTVHDNSRTGFQNKTGLMPGSTDREPIRDLCRHQTRLSCHTYARLPTFSPAISTGISPG